jgi:DNA-binding IclR family transcriptional regulator
MARGAKSPSQRRTNTVSALARGIAVLRCFEADPRPMSNGEVARATHIPKPTVTRLLVTLVAVGYLKPAREPDKYQLSAGVIPLAQAFLRSVDVRAYARPHMVALAEAIGGWAYLAVRNGLEMIIIETCRAHGAVLLSRLDVGSRVPMPNSALGRAYLSALEPGEREAMLEELRRTFGNQWPKLRAGLQLALADAAQHGYCMSVGEWHPDVNSIAVPLLAPGGERMALLCGGPAYAFPADRLRKLVAPQLLQTAKAIAHEIGGYAAIISPEASVSRAAASASSTDTSAPRARSTRRISS